MSETYNGWSNWQTWNVNLWLQNDEGLYNAAWGGRPYTSQSLRELVELELLPDGTPDMDNRLEYDGVDWQEIAEGFNEE